MDDSPLGTSGDDPDASGLSIEDIVEAFRAAVDRRGELEGLGGTTDQPEGSMEDPESASETSPSARDALVERTLGALEKARSSSQEERRIPLLGSKATPRRPEQEEERPFEEESRPESGAEFNVEDSIEDFAPAFREALEGRSGTEETRVEGTGQEPEETESSDRAGEVSPGDGIPSGAEVQVADGTASGGAGRPAPPDSSFLWVASEADEDSTTVSVENLGQPRAHEAAAFLLSGSGPEPYELLTQIRGHANLNVCLKPVFWMHGAGEDSRVARHVDGEWTRDERRALNALRETASSINRRVQEVVGGEARAQGGLEMRLLRFMATRAHEFEPERTVKSSDGFVYPKLTPFVDRGGRGRGGELVQTLSMLEDRRLLSGEFVTRQHACQGCGSAFLNFEERCPNCGAAHLDTQDLVHHFRCAFTGPQREFKREEDRLVCPKCDRSLKQIGVDYDKPSIVHTCRRCQEEFQEPEVQTTCYQCGQTTPPERQIHRDIKTYEVTALGQEAAIYGLSDSLQSVLERESRVLDYATFQLIVDSEAARIERYQRSTASLLLVQVTGLHRLRRDLGQRSQEVVEEIATAFDNTLRSSDYLSARDESLYLFLLTETDEAGARRAGERLETNIEGVLGQNLQHPPGLDIAVQPLHPEVDLDSIAEQFLASQSAKQGQGRAR